MRFTFDNTSNNKLQYGEDPNICPHCHVANEPKCLFVYYDTIASSVISVWQCNFRDCKKVFVVSHKERNGQYYIERYLNGFPKGPIWPKPIIELKDGKTIGTEKVEQSKFIKTYHQSLEAESNGLDEIAGMGYRKAIEYLVKDFAIQISPVDKDKILHQWLSEVIKNYFSGDLKEILDRATWLGNDQAHYNKLLEDYNIDDLKELIDLVAVELDRDFKKRHYIEHIERRK